MWVIKRSKERTVQEEANSVILGTQCVYKEEKVMQWSHEMEHEREKRTDAGKTGYS